MNNTDKNKIIKNIDKKLEILSKTMDEDNFIEFMNNNQIVLNYNRLLNNIYVGIYTSSMKMLLSIDILKKINEIVCNELLTI
mgnify:FL=1